MRMKTFSVVLMMRTTSPSSSSLSEMFNSAPCWRCRQGKKGSADPKAMGHFFVVAPIREESEEEGGGEEEEDEEEEEEEEGARRRRERGLPPARPSTWS